ncbi:MAG: hypothetical protein Q7U38_17065 [Methylobacter sp.]|nr:hypothetical protein [Methylobacter sp.]MDP2098267.1 hypothetical protein [Methylobacter sp.]MDP2426764.1 hypothetical protein [Methylobacter sp.]MDP3054686.1 hypothetical protein [Methylobacter sp.]MDP3361738.1 hypothetical protein [Methylobacter sp.]
MNSVIQEHPSSFLASLDKAFANIEQWAISAGLKVVKSKILITEERFGTYSAQKLSILNSFGTELAEVIPVGASILGANGRIDIKGAYDKVILVDLNIGGPTMTTTVTVGDHKETHARHFYRGIDEAGWYWIESKISGKGHKLTNELFFELLAEVSDYERQ